MSDKSLNRQSLPVRLANQLEEDIEDGVWSGFLPGYRTLCSRYQVSGRTGKSALQILEDRGIIQPTQPGKKRKIRKQTHRSSRTQHLLTITDSMLPLDNLDEQLLHDIADFWLRRAQRSNASRVSGDLGRYRHPEKILKQWITQHAATHILFYAPPSAWVQAVIQLGLPCYYLGGSLSSGDLDKHLNPGSSQRLETSLVQLISRLKELGHKDLLIHYDYDRERLQAALYETFEGELSKKECEEAIPVFPELSPDTWQKNWHREFSKRKSTIVVVSHHFALQSLYVYCARNHIQLGKDLSLVSFHFEEIFNWYDPRPTYLKYPYDKSLQDFKQWVRGGCLNRAHTFLEMKWVEGDTLKKQGD